MIEPSTAAPTALPSPAPLLNRRRLLGLSVPALASSALVPLFPATPCRADAVEDRIAWIRARFNEIEGTRLAEKSIINDIDGDPLFAALKRYEKGGVLQKVYLNFGEGDHMGIEETYYYWQGELFFAYVVHSSWQFTGRTLPSGESETIDASTEHRIYFDGGRAVRHLIKEVSSVDPDAIKGLLAKAQNRPWSDPELVATVRQRGAAVAAVADRASLRRLFE